MSPLLWIHMQKGGGIETDTRTTEALGQGPPTPSLRTSTQWGGMRSCCCVLVLITPSVSAQEGRGCPGLCLRSALREQRWLRAYAGNSQPGGGVGGRVGVWFPHFYREVREEVLCSKSCNFFISLLPHGQMWAGKPSCPHQASVPLEAQREKPPSPSQLWGRLCPNLTHRDAVSTHRTFWSKNMYLPL